MSSELTLTHNQSIKSIEFFPYEWSSNLIAVCLKDSIKIYVYEEVVEQQDVSGSLRPQTTKPRLRLITSNPSNNNRISHFTWSPKTNIATMKPLLQFATCDSENTLTFYNAQLAVNLTCQNQSNDNPESKKSLASFDHVHKIAYDCYHGEYIAYTADNYCFLWDAVHSTLKAKFILQSPGVNICWHRDETNKLMIVEKCGLIRVYNLTTLQPMFTLLSVNKINSLPLLSADWCQLNPAIVIANTNADLFIWNTSNSCLAERLHEDSDCIKYLKLANYKENTLGYVSGNDISCKLKVINYKTNEVVYQKKDIKLFKSFSFNSALPLLAIANENKLTITRILN